MTPQEERHKILNEFVACGQEVSGIVSKYRDFLRLKSMVFNETEREPIDNIADNLSVGLGAIEEAWEQAYAFRARLNAENGIKDAEDKS
jgi:hypothetical protein